MCVLWISTAHLDFYRCFRTRKQNRHLKVSAIAVAQVATIMHFLNGKHSRFDGNLNEIYRESDLKFPCFCHRKPIRFRRGVAATIQSVCYQFWLPFSKRNTCVRLKRRCKMLAKLLWTSRFFSPIFCLFLVSTITSKPYIMFIHVPAQPQAYWENHALHALEPAIQRYWYWKCSVLFHRRDAVFKTSLN